MSDCEDDPFACDDEVDDDPFACDDEAEDDPFAQDDDMEMEEEDPFADDADPFAEDGGDYEDDEGERRRRIILERCWISIVRFEAVCRKRFEERSTTSKKDSTYPVEWPWRICTLCFRVSHLY